MNYEKELEIDLERLGINLIDQPQLIMKYGLLWAKKTAERDRAKQELDVIEAELDGYARANWADITNTKMTEKSVHGFILNEDKYKKAMNKYVNLTEEVNILSVVKNAFEHRKTALEGLVSLFIANYSMNSKIAKKDINEIKSS